MKPLQKEGIPKITAKTRSRKVKENSKREDLIPEECANKTKKSEKDEQSNSAPEGRNRSVKLSTSRKIDTGSAPDKDKSVEKPSARMTRGKRKLVEHEVKERKAFQPPKKD
jgi:hypothetical protein